MIKNLIEKLKTLRLYFVRRSSCDCGDENCKRKVRATKEGRLYIENHFTCGNIKYFVEKYKDVRF
jgi:hypothetical protein